MKNFIILFITSMSLIAFTFVGDSETRNLEKFNSIDVAGSYDITLVQGDEHKAEIEMIKGDIEQCDISVKNGTLYLKFKKTGFKWGGDNNKAKVMLHYSKIKSLDMSAGSKVKTDGKIAAEAFMLDVSSGASATIEVDVNMLEVDLSSGSRAKVNGSAGTQKVDVSSGAAYKASRLESKKANVDVSSGSAASIWVTEEITAEASSGGSVKYKGEPEKKNIDIGKYSGGSIKAVKS